MRPVCRLTEVVAIELRLGRQHGPSICLNHQWVPLQAQLVWLIDYKDSQNEQLDHLTIWFPLHVLTQAKLHMLQYLQSCHCHKTLTRHLLWTGPLQEPIKIRNQLTLACLSFEKFLNGEMKVVYYIPMHLHKHGSNGNDKTDSSAWDFPLIWLAEQ